MNGLEKTRQVLAQSRNRAVLPLLAAGLGSSSPEVRAIVIRAIIQRIDLPSHALVIREFPSFGEAELGALVETHRRMPHHAAPALKAALLGGDSALRENACLFILATCDFESFPALLQACGKIPHGDLPYVAAAILELANRLHDQIAHWSDGAGRSGTDPTFVRHRALSALERFLSHARRAVPREILEAFLLLAPTEHPTLLHILRDEQDHSHSALVGILSTSQNASVFERLVALLRDADAPQAALDVIAGRNDRPFVEFLLQTLRHPVPLRVLHNLKRLRSIAWLESPHEMLLDLDGRSQALAIEIAVAADITRESLFNLLVPILREGLAEGRRAACDALARFSEPQADMLILAALEDPDGAVQAAAARQLRPRRMPDALKVLVELLDAPSAEVRDAARSSLAEFNFVRYRAMFDLLDEQALLTTGALVHKVDHAAIDGLLEELTSPSVSARLRGIEMAVAMQATQEVCQQLVELAKHENVAVRKEALAALADCTGPGVADVLHLAAGDSHPSIADTARQSLARLNQRTTQPGEPAGNAGEPAGLSRPDEPGGSLGRSLPALVALRDLPQVWGRFDNQRPSDGFDQLLLLAGIAAVVAGAMLLWLRLSRQAQRRFNANSPSRLFRELSHVHGLDFSSRRLLKRLANGRRLADPTLLFVEPQHFDTSSLPSDLQPAETQLQRLRTQLFS